MWACVCECVSVCVCARAARARARVRVRVRVCALSRVRHSLCLCVSKFLWVGILEKMGESLELLEYQGGYERGFTVATKNAHKHNAKATDEEKAKLAALMPMDVWFYDHVKVRYLPPSLPPSLSVTHCLCLSQRTHEAKWAAFQAIKETGQAAPLGKEHCPAPAVPMPPLPPADLLQPNALPAEVAGRFGQHGACMSSSSGQQFASVRFIVFGSESYGSYLLGEQARGSSSSVRRICIYSAHIYQA